jgi:uncharacterized protein
VSTLVRTEAARALIRTEPAALPVLRMVLAPPSPEPVTDIILDAAAHLPGATLRSLDAIHLATAEELAPVLSWFVAYNKRLADAALNVACPATARA